MLQAVVHRIPCRLAVRARGFALHVGLDTWDLNAARLTEMPPAVGAVAAATAMERITRAQTFPKPLLLLDKNATLDGVTLAFGNLAAQLNDEDLLVFTLAGHARLHADAKGTLRQQFLLFNGWWSDGQIFELLKSVTKSARILLVLEACYARGLLLPGTEIPLLWASVQSVVGAHMLRDPATRTELLDAFLRSPQGWSRVAASVPSSPADRVTADVLLLAACNNLLRAQAAVKPSNPDSLPPFTEALEKNWKGSTDYYELTSKIGAAVIAPKPELVTTLSKPPAPSGGKAFPNQQPFSI